MSIKLKRPELTAAELELRTFVVDWWNTNRDKLSAAELLAVLVAWLVT